MKRRLVSLVSIGFAMALMACATSGLAQKHPVRRETGTGEACIGLGGPTSPIAVGQPVTLTFTAENGLACLDDPYGPGVPTGTVTLYYQQFAIASATLSQVGTGGYAYAVANFSLPTAGLPAGTYPLVAAYSGDASFLPATSNSVSVVLVNSIATVTTLFPGSCNYVPGDIIPLIAFVTAQNGDQIPTGLVTFSLGSAALGSAALRGEVNNNYAELNLPTSAALVPGTYNIVATYQGNSSNLPSVSATQAFTIVAERRTETFLSATPDPSAQLLRVTVEVDSATCNLTPVGNVTLLANNFAVASLPLQYGSANLTISTAGVPAGTYLLTALYNGTATEETSNSSTDVTVLNEPYLSFQISPNPVQSGTTTFLTLKVTGQSAVPTGMVEFDYGEDELGSAILDATGTAQIPLVTSSLSPGSYQVVADYKGDTKYNETEQRVTLVVQ